MGLVPRRGLEGGGIHFDETLGVEPAAQEAYDLRPSKEPATPPGVSVAAPKRRTWTNSRDPTASEERGSKSISTGL